MGPHSPASGCSSRLVYGARWTNSRSRPRVVMHESAREEAAEGPADSRAAPRGRREFRGGRAAVLYGLLLGLIDEVLVAFHLAQRSFAHQTYSHLRTVEETLDIIDLLNSDESWLNRWLDAATDVQAEIDVYRDTRKEVKKRAGRGKGDPDKLYAFLSATGSHPQFRGLMGRARFDES